ncbi:hypothetical protein TNCV_4501071 [Trichonephila clavipes]|nr:hypothetical protein TNCV_4501071 [Trichonephila clavipes]
MSFSPCVAIVRVQYFVRGGFVGYRSRASSKHLSPHLPVDELDSSGVKKGLRCTCKLHVWVSGLQRNRPDVDVWRSDVTTRLLSILIPAACPGVARASSSAQLFTLGNFPFPSQWYGRLVTVPGISRQIWKWSTQLVETNLEMVYAISRQIWKQYNELVAKS